MPKISNNQIFSIFFVAIASCAYILCPKIVAGIAANNAWLAVLTSLLPGVLIIYVYIYILRNNSHPFPIMLEDHLGRVAGKLLGLTYVFIFLLSAIMFLRSFASFAESTVLPGIPISVLIALIILPAFYAVRSGIEVFARVSELLFLFYLPLVVLTLVLGIQRAELANLMPLGHVSFRNFAYAGFQPLWHIGSLMTILSLAYFSDNRSKIPRILFTALISLILLSSLMTIISIINQGPFLTSELTFPLFDIARATSIGGFIRNIEIIFISIFLAGIFVAISIHWFMACYTCQQVFQLKEYRFLAAPTALILGFSSTLISPNIDILFIIWEKIAPFLFSFFYIGIPLLLAGILLFKPPLDPQAGNGLQAPGNRSEE